MSKPSLLCRWVSSAHLFSRLQKLPPISPCCGVCPIRPFTVTSSSRRSFKHTANKKRHEEQQTRSNASLSKQGIEKFKEHHKEEKQSGAGMDAPLDSQSKRHAAWLISSQFVINMGFGVVVPVLPLFAQSHGLGAFGVGCVLSMPAFSR